MGQVKVEMQVMPADPDVDLGLLKQKIVDCMPSCAKICADISEVPIAFGLKALKVYVLVEDAEGGVESVEQAINALPESADEVRILDMDRF